MEFTTRKLKEGDIEETGRWLEGWNLTPIERGMYPDTGLVLFNREDKQPIYTGYVWVSNSKMAQIGFITRNPYYKVKLPAGVRKFFLEQLISYCKELGAQYIITWAENKMLVNDFKEIGLRETSDKCSELIGKI